MAGRRAIAEASRGDSGIVATSDHPGAEAVTGDWPCSSSYLTVSETVASSRCSARRAFRRYDTTAREKPSVRGKAGERRSTMHIAANVRDTSGADSCSHAAGTTPRHGEGRLDERGAGRCAAGGAVSFRGTAIAWGRASGASTSPETAPMASAKAGSAYARSIASRSADAEEGVSVRIHGAASPIRISDSNAAGIYVGASRQAATTDSIDAAGSRCRHHQNQESGPRQMSRAAHASISASSVNSTASTSEPTGPSIGRAACCSIAPRAARIANSQARGCCRGRPGRMSIPSGNGSGIALMQRIACGGIAGGERSSVRSTTPQRICNPCGSAASARRCTRPMVVSRPSDAFIFHPRRANPREALLPDGRQNPTRSP